MAQNIQPITLLKQNTRSSCFVIMQIVFSTRWIFSLLWKQLSIQCSRISFPISNIFPMFKQYSFVASTITITANSSTSQINKLCRQLPTTLSRYKITIPRLTQPTFSCTKMSNKNTKKNIVSQAKIAGVYSSTDQATCPQVKTIPISMKQYMKALKTKKYQMSIQSEEGCRMGYSLKSIFSRSVCLRWPSEWLYYYCTAGEHLSLTSRLTLACRDYDMKGKQGARWDCSKMTRRSLRMKLERQIFLIINIECLSNQQHCFFCGAPLIQPVKGKLGVVLPGSLITKASFSTQFSTMMSMTELNSSSIVFLFLADTSKCKEWYFSASCSPSFLETVLSAVRSILFPTNTLMALIDWCSSKREVHNLRFQRDAGLVTSQTIMAQLASFMQLGMRLRNRSCPAVSHSWMRYCLLLRETFLMWKSMPTVGCVEVGVR